MGYDISVFKFDNLADVNSAIATINASEGIPVAGGKTTSYAVAEQQDDYYYIQADDVTRKYLTGEVEITLSDPTLVWN